METAVMADTIQKFRSYSIKVGWTQFKNVPWQQNPKVGRAKAITFKALD